MREHRRGWLGESCRRWRVTCAWRRANASPTSPAGQMVVLEPGLLHSVEALAEAAFLLSIAFIGQSGTSD